MPASSSFPKSSKTSFPRASGKCERKSAFGSGFRSARELARAKYERAAEDFLVSLSSRREKESYNRTYNNNSLHHITFH